MSHGGKRRFVQAGTSRGWEIEWMPAESVPAGVPLEVVCMMRWRVVRRWGPKWQYVHTSTHTTRYAALWVVDKAVQRKLDAGYVPAPGPPVVNGASRIIAPTVKSMDLDTLIEPVAHKRRIE